MEFSLNSAAFGAALALICVAGLSVAISMLFDIMESNTRRGGPVLDKAQRIQRYLLAVAILLGQLFLIVALLMKFSPLLNNLVSWALGFVGGIFVFTLLRLPLITRKK